METVSIQKPRSALGGYLDVALFAAIALFYMAAAWSVARVGGPFHADPDYQYLFSGLSILTLRSAHYHDHPGTPVQEIIALVSGISWILTLPRHGLANVRDQVLANSQFYLACSYWVFAAGIAAAMVFFAWSVRKAGSGLFPATIGLLSIFSSAAVYPSFHRVSPEAPLLGATLIMAGLVARQVFASEPIVEGNSLGTTMGILLGFCMAAKITSAPLLLTIFFLRSGQARKAAIFACGVSAFVFLLPALPHARSMMGAYYRILTHRGDYGSHGAGLPMLSDLRANFALQLKTVPEIPAVLVLYLAVLTGTRIIGRRLPDRFERALLICSGIILLGIVLTLKQFRPYYLLPELSFICLANAIVASYLIRASRFPLLLGLIAAAALGAFAIRTLSANAVAAAADWNAEKKIMDRAAQSGCRVIPYYAVDMTVWDLYFGNESEAHIYNHVLARAYPGFLTYNIFGGGFETFDSLLDRKAVVALLSRQKCVYLMGRLWQPSFGIPQDLLSPVTPPGSAPMLYALRAGWAGQ